MNVTIRNMTKGDIASVQAIARKTWDATYEGIIPREVQEKFLNSAYSDERMEYRMNNSHIFIAETSKKVIGFANFSPVNDKGEAELGAIYIYPEYQGAGVGTALLEKGIEGLEGIKKLYVHVEKDNEIGKAFYHAKGFQVIKEFDDDFDGHILKTIQMVLEVE